jgi:hypothetical protein
LASQGIDKNLAHQVRTLGALSEEKFEQVVTDARDAVTRAVKTVMRGRRHRDSRRAHQPKRAANGDVKTLKKIHGIRANRSMATSLC